MSILSCNLSKITRVQVVIITFKLRDFSRFFTWVASATSISLHSKRALSNMRVCVKSAASADDNDERITTTTSSAGNDTRQVAPTVVVMDADGVTPNDGGVHR